MFRRFALLASLLCCVACGSPSTPDSKAGPQPGALTELRAPLDELRTWFDSHRNEARFIAILSPT